MGSLSMQRAVIQNIALPSMYTVKDIGLKHSTYGPCIAQNTGQKYLQTCHMYSRWLWNYRDKLLSISQITERVFAEVLSNYSNY